MFLTYAFSDFEGIKDKTTFYIAIIFAKHLLMEILYTKYAICLYFSDVRTEQKHNTTVGECCDEGNHDVH